MKCLSVIVHLECHETKASKSVPKNLRQFIVVLTSRQSFVTAADVFVVVRSCRSSLVITYVSKSCTLVPYYKHVSAKWLNYLIQGWCCKQIKNYVVRILITSTFMPLLISSFILQIMRQHQIYQFNLNICEIQDFKFMFTSVKIKHLNGKKR